MKFNSFFVIDLFSEHMDIDPEDTAPASVTEPAEDTAASDTAPASVTELEIEQAEKEKNTLVGCCKTDAVLSNTLRFCFM